MEKFSCEYFIAQIQEHADQRIFQKDGSLGDGFTLNASEGDRI